MKKLDTGALQTPENLLRTIKHILNLIFPARSLYRVSCIIRVFVDIITRGVPATSSVDTAALGDKSAQL